MQVAGSTPLRLVAFEVTRRCTLACRHCRGDSRNEDYSGELTFDEIKALFDNIATFAKPIMIITGGEPLTRPDVFDITAYSTELGFRTVLATCGQHLNDETVPRLLETGVQRISVSLDGATSETHDKFRGVEGAFESALRGLEYAKKHGLEFQINSTLTTLNIGELDAIHDLAVSIGAAGFHPFLLVPMGRGSGLSDFALEAEAYEKELHHIAEIAERSPLEIKPTCSPHYMRITRQRVKNASESGTSALQSHAKHGKGGHPGHKMSKGCLGGQGFVFISHTGIVQICGFLELPAGNLRENGLDFNDIWENSPLLHEIRDLDSYHGKCGYCEFRKVCGGCRARAYYSGGDYLGPEPNCIYEPTTESK